jgi:23S rRNA pseudouridine2605 synthase
MNSMRLNKFLAASGVASRRKADQMVTDGRISLNGKVVTELGTQVDPRKDRVEVDGAPIKGPEVVSYIIVNKPVGYITTMKDPRDRPTVLDLVPKKARLFPVGRLDADTEGLLFMMNDGKLAFRLTHPKYEVPKTYRAILDEPVEEKELEQVRKGVMLEDGPTAPAQARLLRKGGAAVEITIHEGRNRQVRRVFEAVGRTVISLKRIRFGAVQLGELKPGQWREMTSAEVRDLKKSVGIT